MKKDIEIQKVVDLAIAIVPREGEGPDSQDLWEVHLVNQKNAPIRSVIVASTGYGEIDGEPRKSTTMRYFWETIGPRQSVMVEPIHPELFALANEFWVSFSFDDYLFDKQYVFVQGAIEPIHFTEIPFLEGRRGVMIR